MGRSYVSSLDKVGDKIASIFIGIVFIWCVLSGIYASVSSIFEFRNYYNLDNRCQTIQGQYISYEVDYPGRYGATKRIITVDDQQYRILTDEFDEEALRNNLRQGEMVTIVVDPKEESVIAISDEQKIYLSYETSKNTIKQIATSAMIMGLVFISVGVISAYFYFVPRKRNRYHRKRWKKRK